MLRGTGLLSSRVSSEPMSSSLPVFCCFGLVRWATEKPRTPRMFQKVEQIPQGNTGCRGKEELGLGVEIVFGWLICAAKSSGNSHYVELESQPPAVSWPCESQSWAREKVGAEGCLTRKFFHHRQTGNAENKSEGTRHRVGFYRVEKNRDEKIDLSQVIQEQGSPYPITTLPMFLKRKWWPYAKRDLKGGPGWAARPGQHRRFQPEELPASSVCVPRGPGRPGLSIQMELHAPLGHPKGQFPQVC